MRRFSILPLIGWMSGALIFFSLMAVSVRELSGTLSVPEMMTIRTLSGFVVLSSLVLVRPSLRHVIRLKHVGSHLVRNGVHLFATVCWMLAVTLLPLATVFALEFTMPVWVALFAVLVLGERLTVPRLATIILGFIGVCVIVRPGLETFQPAALIALAAAFTFAIVAIATKRLTRDETTFAILFWMNLLQLPLSLVFSDPLFPSKLSTGEALPVMGIIVSGLLSHFCLTNAFRAGDALIVVPMDFLRIPLIALIGWTLYGESIDVLVFVGSGFIMAGVFWNLWQESRMSKAGREI